MAERVNGNVRLVGIIILVATTLTTAVIAVVSRTTTAQVERIVKDKQAPLEQKVDNLCEQVRKVEDKQGVIARDINAINVKQGRIDEKLQILIERR